MQGDGGLRQADRPPRRRVRRGLRLLACGARRLLSPSLLFHVSGHGYGHATRTRALLSALRHRAGPELAIHVRSEAPEWLFAAGDPAARRSGAPIGYSRAPIDVGMLQPNGLDLDLEGTLAAHQEFCSGWEATVEREVAFARETGASLVVGDIPPLAFAVAERAGLPSAAVANFSWDWILEHYADRDPSWTPIAERYRAAYGLADHLYRTPLHGDLSCFRRISDVPFVVNVSRREPEECRREIGLPPGDRRRLVLVSFGGFGSGPLRMAAREDLSGYVFAGFGAAPEGFAGEWLALPGDTATRHEDVMQACDGLIGKTGYSTVAEALAHRTRFLFVPRRDFREVPVLEHGLQRLGCALPLTREDFAAGRWRQALDALFALPAPGSAAGGAVATDGAEVVADALLARLA